MSGGISTNPSAPRGFISVAFAFPLAMPERFALITGLAPDRPTCMKCLCEKSGIKPGRMEGMLARISKVMRVHRLPEARCRGRGEQRPVVSVEPPSR